MVAPHPEWEDRADGFSKEGDDDLPREEVHITVMPVRVRCNEGSMLVSAVEYGSETGYSIVVERGVPGYATHDTIITFSDARTAWAFAHLLTHYFVHKTDPTVAVDDLIRSGQGVSPDEQWNPNRIIEELDAREAFEKLLSPSPIPEGMADMV